MASAVFWHIRLNKMMFNWYTETYCRWTFTCSAQLKVMKLGQRLFEFLEKMLTGDIQPWSAAILVTGLCPKEKRVVKYLKVTQHLLNMLSCKGLEARHFYSRFEVSMAQFQNVPLTFNSHTGSDVFYIHSRPQCRADLVNYCIVVLGSCQRAWLTKLHSYFPGVFESHCVVGRKKDTAKLTPEVWLTCFYSESIWLCILTILFKRSRIFALRLNFWNFWSKKQKQNKKALK